MIPPGLNEWLLANPLTTIGITERVKNNVCNSFDVEWGGMVDSGGRAVRGHQAVAYHVPRIIGTQSLAHSLSIAP